MVSVTIRDRFMRPGERAHIRGEVIFGYTETLNPADVELKTIETLQLTPKGITGLNIPVGSVAAPGNIGNSATISWLTGTSGDTYGSVAVGSATAYFDIIGG